MFFRKIASRDRTARIPLGPGRRRRRPAVEAMERREMMTTGISLNPSTGLLTLFGTTTNDVAKVTYATKVVGGQAVNDPTQLSVSFADDGGYADQQTIPVASVSSILFVGKGGNDVFTNGTTITSSYNTTSTGVVSTTLLTGAPGSQDAQANAQVGQFTVGSTGNVTIDYLYDGAGYRGQLGIYSLDGMDAYTPGSSAYNEEAARRVLSNSTLGHVVISVSSETAKFDAKMPWESDFHDGHGSYAGPKTFSMTAGDTFGAMLIPNGTASQVYANPSATGSLQPLYSVPAADPYTVTPQLRGQVGDLDGHGSLFSFEDISLANGSDRDYNDMVFQVTGARGLAAPVSEMVNSSRNFQTTDIFQQIETYAATNETADQSAENGSYSSGTNTVGSSGQVTVDYLYDGGGYQSQMAIFSLQGMGNLTPGSPDFIKEAARRALSDSVLGHVVISDGSEGAKTSVSLPWESGYNSGSYLGIKTFAMTPGDQFATMLVPAGTVWEAYSNPSNTDPKKQPLFSIPEANPTSENQLASYDSNGTTFGWEDNGLSTGKSDRDYNDIIYRLGGATGTAPALSTVALAAKNTLNTSQASTILA